MVARKASAGAAKPADRPEFSATASRRPVVDDSKANDGGPGPKSSLKTGTPQGESSVKETGKINYSVQIHTDEKGLEVFEPIAAESGDEAAKIALEKKNFRGASVRGVTPYSDPDPNSLGGERDAGIMIANAENPGAVNVFPGTEDNAEAVEKLGKADISELGE
jgi:hypothetical protein